MPLTHCPNCGAKVIGHVRFFCCSNSACDQPYYTDFSPPPDPQKATACLTAPAVASQGEGTNKTLFSSLKEELSYVEGALIDSSVWSVIGFLFQCAVLLFVFTSSFLFGSWLFWGGDL